MASTDMTKDKKNNGGNVPNAQAGLEVVSTVDMAEVERLKKQLAAEAEKLANRDEDVVGYWEPSQLPIHCIPRTVRLFDSSIDKSKFSALITAEALSPTVIENEKDGKTVQWLCKKGDMVGVWYKPGMRGIASTAGVPTVITETGEKKDVGKGNPMTVYSVRATGGTPLPITNDSRNKSAGMKTPFDVKQSDDPRGPAAENASF